MNIKKNRFFMIFVTLIIAVLGLMVLADIQSNSTTQFDVASPVNLTNASGNVLLLNATTNTTLENVTFIFNHFSNGSQYYNTTINDTTDTLNKTFDLRINASSVLTDGLFRMVVNGSEVGNVTFANETTVILVDTVAPDVQTLENNFSDRQNFTTGATITFNVTVANGTTETGINVSDLHSVIFNVTNGTGVSFLLASDLNHSGTPTNDTLFNASIAVSGMADGNHTVFILVNDTAGNLNDSESISFIVDTTAPSVIDLRGPTNLSTVTEPTFIWEINDSLSEVFACDVVVNDVINSSFTNITNGTPYYFTPSVAFADAASFNWSVSCNDSVLQTNVSATRNFTIDSTLPTVSTSGTSGISISGGTLDITTSEVATCRYDTSDVSYSAMGSIMSGTGTTTHSASIGALGSGTTNTYYVLCQDTTGNNQASSTKLTFTTTSSGGGSGGSSGGTSSGAAGVSAKRTWTSINAGETAEVLVSNGVIGVTKVSFDVSKTVYGAWTRVQKRESFPSTVKVYNKEVYRMLDITKNNVLKDDLVSNGKVDFKVEKIWLDSKKLSNEDIVLLRYVDDAWTQLKTTVGQDDGTYVHFSAETPGFSYFIIGEKAVIDQGEKAVVEVPTANQGDAVKADADKGTTPPELGEPASSSSVKAVLVVLLVLVLVVAAIFWWRRRK